MKVLIYKHNPKMFRVVKETTKQSILTDFATILVIAVIFGAVIAFNLLIGRSWILEIFAVTVIFLWFYSQSLKKRTEMTKDELKKMIDDL